MRISSRKSFRLITSAAGAGVLVLATGIGASAASAPAPEPTAAPAPTTSADPTSSPAPTSTSQPEPTTSKPEPTTTQPGGDSEGSALTVSPQSARPGQSVVVRLTCLGDKGSTSSPALRMGRADGAAGSLYENATVASVKPGTYSVTSSCAGKPLSASLTVLGAKKPSKPVPISEHQVTVVPKGAAETGDGSLAGLR